MAHKLLAPFKKFPQQLPIFKKSSDKCKDISLSNYNAVYGMLDDITSQAFDDRLHLFAIGTKRGEIKIYGSENVVYTLVANTLKSINVLKFLHGQGRLLSVTSDNDIMLWEYKVEFSCWEVSSTLSLGNLVPNCNIMTLDISNPLSWKSNDDNLLELLLIGLSNNNVKQILIVGNRFHVYDGDDLTINCEGILTKCQDLDKEYEFGEIVSIKFNSINNERFFVGFSNGLVLFMKSNLEEPKSTTEDCATKNEDAKMDEIKEQDTTNFKIENDVHHNGDSHKDTVDDEKEKTENGMGETEIEKPKIINEEVKVEGKAEIKKIKESVQVPFVSVKLPLILNYATNNKINTICWSDNDVVVNYHDSNDLCFYNESDVNGKQVESHKLVTLKGDFSFQLSHPYFFKRKNDNIFAFVSKTEDRPNLLCLAIDNHIDAEFETPSRIIDYAIVKDQVTDENSTPNARALLILCESQLIAIDLTSERYTELQCPYLVFRNISHVTAVTSIIQVSSALFSDHKTAKELFQDWPLNTPLPSNNATNEEYLDIIATGHSDGAITIWQVRPSGVISVLTFIRNSDLFRVVSTASNLITENSLPRRQVGHHLINSDDTLLRINNIQLIQNITEGSSDVSVNELFCVAGNYSGTVFVFKYDKSKIGNDLVEIVSNIKDCHEKEDIIWNDTEAPELLNSSQISAHITNLTHIIKLNPSLPVTAVAFKPQWNMLAVGCTYGFVLVDLSQNNTVFSYSTIIRPSKNDVVQTPLTVGQQLKKSMRQSFRKLKKLKPSTKHTYNVNEEKSKGKDKDKEENDKEKEDKPDVKIENGEENDKNSVQGELIPEKADEEDKDKTEDSVKSATLEATETPAGVPDIENEPPIEISRKDKPSGTIGTLLIEATNLVSTVIEPCLFAGTHMGSIYAFELKFGFDGLVTVILSKELHLQHKAPVLLIGIVNSNHVPLVCTNDVSSYQRKWSAVEDKMDDKSEKITDTPVIEPQLEVGPSGDTDENDAKLKAGTLPTPLKSHEDGVEKVKPARKSVDGGKDKAISPNTTMKKSGTLPSSFLQALGKGPGNGVAHELLVVSEEQVKIFSLPSLKAKYKYKVVDTGHHFAHTKPNNIQETEQNSHDKQFENVDSNNVDGQATKKLTRRISTVGLCKVPNFKQTSNKWGVSVALTNGEFIVLTLNNLKKYLSNLYNAKYPILTSLSNGETNLVLSFSHHYNMQITDFSQSGTHYFEPSATILIPDSARPITKVYERSDQPAEEVNPDDHKHEVVITNGQKSECTNGHAESNEIEEENDQLGNEKTVQNSSATHHGDVTMDSIKEYITNMDGNITVKTIESSNERQLNANDDHIGSTVHEKQMKCGEVIKDETLKITSDTVGNNAITLNE